MDEERVTLIVRSRNVNNEVFARRKTADTQENLAKRPTKRAMQLKKKKKN
jgi:hypothetical protein